MSRSRRTVLGAAAGALSFALAGCAGGDGGGETPTATDSPTTTETPTSTPTDTETPTATSTETNSIAMVDTGFDPVRVRVAPGTTVTWTNEDGYGHDVTSAQFHDVAESWQFESGTVGGGGTASHTFDGTGVYEYYCSIHGESTMCGVVLVGDASLDASLPCESGGR